jgi:DNA-binding CsgD family transcriptional regulator
VITRAARAEASLLGGDPARCAREALALRTERLPPWSAGVVLVWAHRAGAALPGPRELPEPLRRELAGDHAAAAAIWEGRGAVYQAVMARAFSGDERLLRRAHSELLELGAHAAARLVARRLRERGARGIARGPRPATRANPAGLTTREVEVLWLLAGGLHNNEIAGRLYVSPRTIDSHVSRILHKLGVRTRVEAVAEAARLGLRQDQ